MSDLELKIALERTPVSQLESVKVVVTLTNRGPSTSVPSAYDISGALAFFLRSGETLVRRASGLTHQEMMIRGRVSAEPNLDELDGGAHWTVTIDLGQWMYAPPPGHYRLTAELLVSAESAITSNEVELEISSQAVVSARALRDNPVLDGLALVLQAEAIESGKAPTSQLLLRQYNHAKPLAAWYGEALPVPPSAALARPTYFVTDSFDHFFQRWFVWLEGDRVVAQAFVNGKPTQARMAAPFPSDLRWLPTALEHVGGRLELFALRGTELVAFELEPGALKPHFVVPLPHGAQGLPELIGDAQGYTLVVARSGIARARLDRDGRVSRAEDAPSSISVGHDPWQQLFNTDLECATLALDPVDRRVLASFWDGAVGRHMQLIEGDLVSAQVSLLYLARAGALSAIDEFAFDRDTRGVFHALAHTSEGLFYQRHDEGPEFLVPRGIRRAPLVSARPALHLGFYDVERGYNFYAFRRGLLFRDPAPENTEAP